MSYHSKNPRFSSTILTDQGGDSVDNPASGSHKLVNRLGEFYIRDSGGGETPLGAAASSTATIDAAAGASGVTLGSVDESVHVFTPSSNITVKLDNTYAAGRNITIRNNGSSGAVITVTANDDSTIGTVRIGSVFQVMCTSSTPSDNGDWMLVAPAFRFQTKILASSKPSAENNTDISGLTFTGLEVGKVYRVSGRVTADLDSATTNLELYIKDQANNAGTTIDFMLFAEANVDVLMQQPINTVFVAATTAIYFNFRSAAGDDSIIGDGTRTRTFVTLEELPNYTATTAW